MPFCALLRGIELVTLLSGKQLIREIKQQRTTISDDIQLCDRVQWPHRQREAELQAVAEAELELEQQLSPW